MTYSFHDCLDIIAECVTEALDNSTKFDYLTSSDKKMVERICGEILDYAEEITKLKKWCEEGQE